MSFDLKVNDTQRQSVFQLQLIMKLCHAMILLALFVQNGFFSEKCSPKRKIAFVKTHKTGSSTLHVRKVLNFYPHRTCYEHIFAWFYRASSPDTA